MNFTGGKDTDKYFLEGLDDRELFSIMQTNKEYLKLGQDFFEKRMKKNYPILASRKPEDVTWFKYYIDNVFYISKLKEDYNLDYYNVPSFYPKTIYHRLYYSSSFKTLKKIREYKITLLIENGDYEKAIKYVEDLNIIDMYERREYERFLLSQILKVGNIDLFEKMAKKYDRFPIYRDWILIEGALQTGKEEVIDYIIQSSGMLKYETFYSSGIEGAIKSGNLDIFDYFIKKYPEEKIDWYLSINALYGENLNIFKKFLKKDLESEKNREKEKEFLESMGRHVIVNIIKEGKLDFLKYAVNFYKSHGGNMKELIKTIKDYFEKEEKKGILDRDIRRYIQDLEKSL